jgi:hypothetical protein
METPDFQAWVGKKFTVDLRGTKIELELTSFREFPPRFVPGLREKPFALLFRGPLRPSQFRRITTADPRDAGRRRENIFDLPGTDRQYR